MGRAVCLAYCPCHRRARVGTGLARRPAQGQGRSPRLGRRHVGQQYLWRGFDFYDDKSAAHVLTDLSLFDTGFGLSVAGHRAAASGFEDK